VDERRGFRKVLPMRPGLRLVVAASEVQAVGGATPLVAQAALETREAAAGPALESSSPPSA
jgi:hypothetical protein